MADKRTAGFMQQLGIGNTEQLRHRTINSGSRAGDFANIARTMGRGPATQALAGVAGGVGGLISGEGGRGVKEFGRDFAQGVNDFRDGAIARDEGITVERLRNRRTLKKELEGISVGGGTLPEQINAAQQIARKANQMGDVSVALNAAQMATQLRKQLEEQKQAGIETEGAEIELEAARAEEDIGVSASIIGRDDLGDGKAVRLDSERAQELGYGPESVGKFVFVDKDGVRHIVDGADVLPEGVLASKLNRGGITPSKDTVDGVAFLNGAGPSKIAGLRAPLKDMGQQADVLLEVSTLLQTLASPDFGVGATGKGVIKANSLIRLMDNTTKILVDADKGTGASAELTDKYTWGTGDDKVVVNGEKGFYEKFKERGKDQNYMLRTLNNISGADEGSLADYLPANILENLKAKNQSIEQIAIIAEQYFANVMELAYIEARLSEPSNRGLSDKDIINALMRIGAHTANPASFAERQDFQMRRMLESVDSLGSMFTIPPGAKTSLDEVIDYVYKPEVRDTIRNKITTAQASIQPLRDPAMTGAAPPQPQLTPTPSVELGQVRKAMADGTLSQEMIDSLSDEDFAAIAEEFAELEQ